VGRGFVGDSRVCPYCGAWLGAHAHACPLCGRSIGGAETDAVAANARGRAASYSPDASEALEVLQSLTVGQSPLALAVGPLFILGYPWLLALYAAQPTGSVRGDLVLALLWLAPEVYLLAGVVKSAQYANANRRAVLGLIPMAVSVVAQLLVLPVALGWTPAGAQSAQVWGVAGTALSGGMAIVVFAAVSAVAALIGAAAPRVVPGKFNRMIGPQLGGISLALVALLLPHWGGLAVAKMGLDIGVPVLWVNVLAVFTFVFVALVWFRPQD
jgi:hypothetical protein